MPTIPVDIKISLELEPGEVIDSVGSEPAAHGFDVWAIADGIKRVIARIVLVPKEIFHTNGKRIKPGTLAHEMALAKPEDVTMTPARRRKAA